MVTSPLETAVAYPERKLVAMVNRVKALVLESLEQPCIEDIAFIGNASDRYVWEPAMIIDLDVCIFVKAMDRITGVFLLDLSHRITDLLARQDAAFEFKIVRGPYKPTPMWVTRPFMVLHGAVFTEETYLAEAPILRWGWKKYSCQNEPDRLARLAPQKPGIPMLLAGPKGIQEKIAGISSGRVLMQERILPELNWVSHEYTPNHPLFAEYCLNAGATTARNHARVAGRPEADSLPNSAFFPWYHREIFSCEAFLALMEGKAAARHRGYGGLMPRVRDLALEYLRRLRLHLEK